MFADLEFGGEKKSQVEIIIGTVISGIYVMHGVLARNASYAEIEVLIAGSKEYLQINTV